MKDQLMAMLSSRLSGDAFNWLEENIRHLHEPLRLARVFTQMPRKTGKAVLKEGQETGFYASWSSDRLARVYLLTCYTNADQDAYYKTIEQLFSAADVNEQVALYSALPFLSWPHLWTKRCAEGIRSNIGDVLEAIMYNNPFPAEHLEEKAWNQMILKAFFTDKRTDLIVGLTERNNRELALILLDYVHERQAAARTVNPAIWLLIGQQAEETFMSDFERVLAGKEEEARNALAKGIAMSDYEPAKQLILADSKNNISL
jgi:hypothetical protein